MGQSFASHLAGQQLRPGHAPPLIMELGSPVSNVSLHCKYLLTVLNLVKKVFWDFLIHTHGCLQCGSAREYINRSVIFAPYLPCVFYLRGLSRIYLVFISLRNVGLATVLVVFEIWYSFLTKRLCCPLNLKNLSNLWLISLVYFLIWLKHKLCNFSSCVNWSTYFLKKKINMTVKLIAS